MTTSWNSDNKAIQIDLAPNEGMRVSVTTVAAGAGYARYTKQYSSTPQNGLQSQYNWGSDTATTGTSYQVPISSSAHTLYIQPTCLDAGGTVNTYASSNQNGTQFSVTNAADGSTTSITVVVTKGGGGGPGVSQ